MPEGTDVMGKLVAAMHGYRQGIRHIRQCRPHHP
jgi:hypothetical protein